MKCWCIFVCKAVGQAFDDPRQVWPHFTSIFGATKKWFVAGQDSLRLEGPNFSKPTWWVKIGYPKIKWLKQNRTNDYQLGRKSSPKNGRYVFLAIEPCPNTWSFFAGTSALERSVLAPRRPAGRCLCKLWQSLPGWSLHLGLPQQKTGRWRGLTTPLKGVNHV